ncbi:MAG: hypothetical protein M3154_01425, partial [Candidatus Eremiobacteraeota bacterium]|nr:hypothetical protein [Candidatus Eremiobacteraeota bacterium]
MKALPGGGVNSRASLVSLSFARYFRVFARTIRSVIAAGNPLGTISMTTAPCFHRRSGRFHDLV